MAVVFFNQLPIDMTDPLNWNDFYGSIASTTHSPTSWSSANAATGGVWQFTGVDFADYQTNVPFAGTITGITYSVNGVTLFSVTGSNASVSTFLANGLNGNWPVALAGIFPGAETITGTTGDDHLEGFAGDDTLDAGLGNDYVRGGNGVDSLTGGDGADNLSGGVGNDVVHGGAGDDTFESDLEADQLFGEDGNDRFYANLGDLIDGGTGNDLVTLSGDVLTEVLRPDQWRLAAGQTLSDGTIIRNVEAFTIDVTSATIAPTLTSGPGYSPFNTVDFYNTITLDFSGTTLSIDMLQVSTSQNNITVGGDLWLQVRATGYPNSKYNVTGTAGSDTLRGGLSHDVINGGGGGDSIYTYNGNDIVSGGGGDDTIHIDFFGNDTIDGGADVDTVWFLTDAITVDLRVTTLQDTGHDSHTITNVENVSGTFYGDTIIGNTVANVLTGWQGDDTLDGGGGADTLIGGTGNDTFHADGADTVTELSNEGTDGVFASATHTLGSNVENLTLLDGGAYAGYGNVDANVITGNASANVLGGNAGADTLNGGGGDDALEGGADADSLTGGAGRDTGVYGIQSGDASWHRNLDGSWTVDGGALGIDTTSSVEFLQLADRSVFLDRAYSTFSGDGASDVFMQHSSGAMGAWFVNGSGVSGAAGLGALNATWDLKGVGDFNGDAKDDILMWNDNGFLGMWFMNGASVSSAAGPGAIDKASWDIEGIGDLNGDGKDDILMWHDNGSLGVWFMNGSSATGASLGGADKANWDIEGLGDLNGDGRDDILWRNSSGDMGVWFMDGASANGAGLGNVGLDWAIEGLGDFNGDGRDDILMRHDSGSLGVWFMDGASATGAGLGAVDQTFAVAAIGDYNADGKDDILWWNDNGNLGAWFMNGAAATGLGYGNVSHDWIIDPS